MKRLILCLILTLGWVLPSHANLRSRIKERWIKKQESKEAPDSQAPLKLIEKPGDFTFSLDVAGSKRLYKLHVPTKYRAGTPIPLLVVLHGGGGDMGIQSTDEFYKQISKSESEGFVVAFPNGYSRFASGKLATWNAGHCCGQGRDTKSDDVAFIRNLVKTTREQLSIDPNRIYAAGMSNGGMMSYRLACEAGDVFKAIASVAGTDNTKDCTPIKPISILHIHAKDDDHVLFNGGAGEDAFKDKTQVTEFVSVPKTIEKWTKLESCEAKPKRVLEVKGASCERYSECKSGTKIQLCVTDSGGHSWPGGKKPRAGFGGTPSTAISANDVMWDFFKSLP